MTCSRAARILRTPLPKDVPVAAFITVRTCEHGKVWIALHDATEAVIAVAGLAPVPATSLASTVVENASRLVFGALPTAGHA